MAAGQKPPHRIASRQTTRYRRLRAGSSNHSNDRARPPISPPLARQSKMTSCCIGMIASPSGRPLLRTGD